MEIHHLRLSKRHMIHLFPHSNLEKAHNFPLNLISCIPWLTLFVTCSIADIRFDLLLGKIWSSSNLLSRVTRGVDKVVVIISFQTWNEKKSKMKIIFFLCWWVWTSSNTVVWSIHSNGILNEKASGFFVGYTSKINQNLKQRSRRKLRTVLNKSAEEWFFMLGENQSKHIVNNFCLTNLWLTFFSNYF